MVQVLSKTQTKGSGILIHKQTRRVVKCVYEYCKTEKDRRIITIPLEKLHERVATMTGVSINYYLFCKNRI